MEDEKYLQIDKEKVLEMLNNRGTCRDVKSVLVNLFGDQLKRTREVYESGSIFMRTGSGFLEPYALTHMADPDVRRSLWILIHKEKSQEYGLRNLYTGQSLINYKADPSLMRETKGLIYISDQFLRTYGLKHVLSGSMS